MNKNDEIKSLIAKISEADVLYHTFDASTLSDAEYDALKDRLKALDPKNPILRKIGSAVDAKSTKGAKAPKEAWTKVNHGKFKMGSQSKVNTPAELKDWCAKTPATDYVVQHKMDGMSMKLTYDKGALKIAATRGEGDIGEDIYRNAIKISSIPKTIKLNKELIVRGEIILTKSKFDLVGGKNCRNSAAGAAKRLDGTGCEHLTFIAYTIMNWKETGLSTETDCIEFLKLLGFTCVTTYICKDADTIERTMDQYRKSLRASLDWDIDGLVVKTNDIKDDDWALPTQSVAYKFQSETAISKLIDVIWQDKGGRICPVGIIEPVDIAGTTVSRATLNNVEYIKEKGLQIGDLVVVSRRNDVIPHIESVSVADPHGKPIIAPSKDEDGYPIVRETNSQGEELVYLISTNPNSIRKKIRQILSWYEAHDTKGVAQETISLILEANIATDLPSFFKIGLDGHTDLAGLDGFGAGKFRILNKATRMTMESDVIKFMNGMDLSGFGTSRYEAILEYVKKPMGVKELIAYCSNVSVISTIPGFGINTAQSLANLLKEKEKLIEDMLKLVKVAAWTPMQTISSKINGLSFCFTGAMTYSRDEMEIAVKKRNGIIAGVSKKLDYLVTNDPNSGSDKNKKAMKLGIKRITEKQFLDMIGGTP